MIRLLLITIIFLSPSIKGTAQNWFYIGTSQGEGKYYVYYKTEKPELDIFNESNSFNIWVKIEEKTFKYFNGAKQKTYYNVVVKYLYHVNCNTNSISKKHVVVYDAKGELITSEDFYEMDSVVVPESMGESILEASCMLHKKELLIKD